MDERQVQHNPRTNVKQSGSDTWALGWEVNIDHLSEQGTSRATAASRGTCAYRRH